MSFFEPVYPPSGQPRPSTDDPRTRPAGPGAPLLPGFPKPGAPSTPATPPSDFQRLADVTTDLYTGQHTPQGAAAPVVLAGGATSGGGSSVGLLLVIGVVGAVIAWGLIHWWTHRKARA